MLNLSSGPECPDCGCTDTTVTHPPQPGTWFARAGRARCNHCGNVFAVRDLPPPDCSRPEPMLGGLGGQAIEGRSQEPALDVPPPTPHTPLDPEPLAVQYHVLRCPSCASDEVQTTSTRRPVRYHKCRTCGANFKSVEHGETR